MENKELDPRRMLLPLELSGGNSLPSRILPGPMEGVMTPEFCRAMMEFDLVPMWTTPFIRISHNTPHPKTLVKKLKQFRPLPIVAQIMGTEREYLAKTAGILASLEGVLGVELNCACSSPAVIRGGSGSVQLRNPAWIRDTLMAIRDAVPSGGVGLKIRSGFESPDELPHVLETVSAAKPDWIVLHYRTAREKYDRVPDGHLRFKIARQLLPASVLFASGDLLSCGQALQLIRHIGVDGITPARGLMHNPWLIRDLELLCRGEKAQGRNLLFFLVRLLEMGIGRSKWSPGPILEIARHAWGEKPERLSSLAKHQQPAEMLAVLHEMIRTGQS